MRMSDMLWFDFTKLKRGLFGHDGLLCHLGLGILRQLLLGSLLLLLYDLADGGCRLLNLPLLEFTDLVTK